MSLSLALYLVDLGKLRGAIGGRDDKLRRQICGRFKAELERADEWFDTQIASGAPSRRDALRAVIEGGPFDERYGFQYGYAYEMICQHFGKFLNNDRVSSFRGDWLETVDAGLGKLGMTVKVTSFMYGSMPRPLPRPDDFPGYGEWTRADCHAALAQWDASAPRRSEVEPEVLEAVSACAEWLLAVRAKPDCGIAGFGY
jgi:hypothetical protein